MGAIEGGHQIAMGKLVSLSVQQLTDCVPYDCHGGYLQWRFVYALDGITTEAAYPQRLDRWHGICQSKGMVPAVSL